MYHCNRLHCSVGRNRNALCLRTVTAVHFTDQNRISKTVYCIRCAMVCKIAFPNWNAKITLLHASIVVIYYIKLFQTGADRHNGNLMSLLLLVAETNIKFFFLASLLLKERNKNKSIHLCYPCHTIFLFTNIAININIFCLLLIFFKLGYLTFFVSIWILVLLIYLLKSEIMMKNDIKS